MMFLVPDSYPAGVEGAFTTAVIVPAVASTIKQAQREAGPELHILADYYQTHQQRHGVVPLDAVQEAATVRLGRILVEQGVTGTLFFLAVKTAVALGGVEAGMLAQVFITGNTMVNPTQALQVNPGRRLCELLDTHPDWVHMLSPLRRQALAALIGALATKAGYGGTRHADGRNGLTLAHLRSGINWKQYLAGPWQPQPPRFGHKR
jgi:hypothetical protein